MVQSFNLVREERFKSYPAREVGGTIGEARVSLSPAQHDASASAGIPAGDDPLCSRCELVPSFSPLCCRCYKFFFFRRHNFFPEPKSKQCKERNTDREPTADAQSLQIRRSSRPHNEAVSTLEIKKARESRVSSLSTGSVIKKNKKKPVATFPAQCLQPPPRI